MTRQSTVRLVVAIVFLATGVLGGLVADHPAVVALAVPGVLTLAALAQRPVECRGSLDVVRPTALAGETIELHAHVEPSQGLASVELRLDVPEGLEVERRLAVRVPEAGLDLAIPVQATHWGAGHRIRARLIGRDALGLTLAETEVSTVQPLRVYPRTEELRQILSPGQLRAVGGTHRSRHRGEGIEYAETRPFASGDRLGRVNWRASARGAGLWVDERHPEMGGDVVLFLDSFAEWGPGRDTTLALSIEAALAVSQAHLGLHDRVGLVDLGGSLRWIEAAIGARQAYRLVEALLDSELVESWADKGLDVIPARGIPPRSLVIALTPLLDTRIIGVLLELRSRRFDLVVVECRAKTEAPPPTDASDALAQRLWTLERQTTRSTLRRAGASLVAWDEGTPLAGVILQAAAMRRQATLVRGHAS